MRKYYLFLTTGVISSSVFIDNSFFQIILTLVISILIIIILSGFRLRNAQMKEYSKTVGFNKSMVSEKSFWVLFHSHHSEILLRYGKELRMKGKFYCTGCYGSLTGIFTGDIIVIFYLWRSFSETSILIITILLPFFFIPIILRYLIFSKMKHGVRFVSNMLLPIGCWLILIIVDHTHGNSFYNGIVVLIFVGLMYFRTKISDFENRKINKQNAFR